MPGFDALYKQTVTLFNRITDDDGDDYFIPIVLSGVHLIVDHSATWNTYGGQQSDNIRLHIRYLPSNGNVMIADKKYYEPKEWRKLDHFDDAITLRYGNDNDFDFFVKGVHEVDGESMVNEIVVNGVTVTCSEGFIKDDYYERHGFYNYLNREYDHVFAITAVSQYNLIPHFEVMAR